MYLVGVGRCRHPLQRSHPAPLPTEQPSISSFLKPKDLKVKEDSCPKALLCSHCFMSEVEEVSGCSEWRRFAPMVAVGVCGVCVGFPF